MKGLAIFLSSMLVLMGACVLGKSVYQRTKRNVIQFFKPLNIAPLLSTQWTQWCSQSHYKVISGPVIVFGAMKLHVHSPIRVGNHDIAPSLTAETIWAQIPPLTFRDEDARAPIIKASFSSCSQRFRFLRPCSGMRHCSVQRALHHLTLQP